VPISLNGLDKIFEVFSKRTTKEFASKSTFLLAGVLKL